MLSLPNCGIVRILSCKIEDMSGLVLKFEWLMPLHLNHVSLSPTMFSKEIRIKNASFKCITHILGF